MKSSLVLRTVALDTALIGNLSRDHFSKDTAVRARAMVFRKSLTALGLVPLVSWHHLEELLRHENLEVARARFGFLQSLPIVAWNPGYRDPGLPGSVVDILAHEVAAAFQDPQLDAMAIRDSARPKLCIFGSGEQMPSMIDGARWEYLRALFRAREQRSREIVAISRATHIDVSKEKAFALLNGTLRRPEDAARMFSHLLQGLKDQITSRGDRRIADPAAVATDFMSEVIDEGSALLKGAPELRFRFLEQFGVYSSDIQPETLMSDVYEIGTFRSQLKIANKYLQHPWKTLIKIVTPQRIPSWQIVNGLRHHGQDLAERKGSDLTDSYLAVLSAYSDFSFVDKRTNENLARVFRKEPLARTLVRHVDKGGLYFDLPEKVRRWDRTSSPVADGISAGAG